MGYNGYLFGEALLYSSSSQASKAETVDVGHLMCQSIDGQCPLGRVCGQDCEDLRC